MAYIKTSATSFPIGARDNPLRRLAIRREAQRNFAADKFFFWGFVVCLGFVILQILLILVTWHKLPPQLPLYYSHPWGETVLAKPVELWILPIIAASFTVVNFLIALTLFGENRFLHRILVVASLVVVAAAFYDLFKIVSLIV